MIKENMCYLEYTYLHRKAFKYVVNLLIKDPKDKAEMLERAKLHDLDKALMYTLIPKKRASKIHRQTSSHHMENGLQKNRYDFMEAVLDYECAGLTKPDKPLNAFDTINKYGRDNIPQLMEIMKELGIDCSYERKPDEDFNRYISSFLPVKEEDILTEIYEYVLMSPNAAFYIYSPRHDDEEDEE